MGTIPIIFMTASNEPGFKERALGKYGAAGFLAKPFEASDLLSTIHTALEDSAGVSAPLFAA